MNRKAAKQCRREHRVVGKHGPRKVTYGPFERKVDGKREFVDVNENVIDKIAMTHPPTTEMVKPFIVDKAIKIPKAFKRFYAGLSHREKGKLRAKWAHAIAKHQ